MLNLDSVLFTFRLDDDIDTTNQDIDRIFGDLIVDKSAGKLTELEYIAIIDRCDANNWPRWKNAWEEWRQQGNC